MIITSTELEEFSTTEGVVMYMWFVCGVGGSIAVHVPLPEDVGGSGCKRGALVVEVIGTGVALGNGVGTTLTSHFLRKRRFLSVILPDPSTLIRYRRSGRTDVGEGRFRTQTC